MEPVVNAEKIVESAMPENGFSLGLGSSASVSPYKEYDAEWSVFPIVNYEGDHAYVRELAAGVKLVNRDPVEFSVFAAYDDTKFKPSLSSDKKLRRLDARGGGGLAGADARLFTPLGMLHADCAVAPFGRSGGLRGTVGCMQSFEFGPLELIPTFGARWSDAKRNRRRYGVSRKEARKSGLRAYRPGADVSPYLGLTIDHSITDKLEFLLGGEVEFLGGAAANSPLTGGRRVYTVVAGFVYDVW